MKIYQYSVAFEGKKLFKYVRGVSFLSTGHEIDLETEMDRICASFRRHGIRKVRIISCKLVNVIDSEKECFETGE